MAEGVHARQGEQGGLDPGLARTTEERGSLAVGSLMETQLGGHRGLEGPPDGVPAAKPVHCAGMSSTRRRNEQGSQ